MHQIARARSEVERARSHVQAAIDYYERGVVESYVRGHGIVEIAMAGMTTPKDIREILTRFKVSFRDEDVWIPDVGTS